MFYIVAVFSAQPVKPFLMMINRIYIIRPEIYLATLVLLLIYFNLCLKLFTFFLMQILRIVNVCKQFGVCCLYLLRCNCKCQRTAAKIQFKLKTQQHERERALECARECCMRDRRK